MRKLCRVLMALPLLCLSMNICLAQYTQTSVKLDSKTLENFRLFQKTEYDSKYYLLLTFNELPDAKQRAQLQDYQIQLLSYQSKKTYLAAVPVGFDAKKIKSLNISTVASPDLIQKVDERLLMKDFPEWTTRVNGKVDVAILFHDETKKSQIETFINNNEITLLEDEDQSGTVIIASIDVDQIESIANSPLVAYMDVKAEPIRMLNRETCVNQKVNILNSSIPGGYGLMGYGVTVGVGDGGELGDHIDFGQRVINEANGTYSSFGDHGDHVSGIIGSAGNINPRHRGMAPECTIVTQKTSQITSNAATYLDEYDMVLTNNSYGTSFNCTTNGSYNYSAQKLDLQLRDNPKLLHVFAAGNSGGGTCEPYPQGYRSVLRYYQSAKNVLTVGMTEENRVIAHSSSRGPVLDGRIKPEIIGVGRNVTSTSNDYNYSTKGGTSMAAPAVTGTLALMVEKYRNDNNDADPDGALLKAIACNTADDLGNPGPDYIHGFGLINGLRAINVIDQNQYNVNNIEHGAMDVQAVSVPEGTKQLKVMLYWPDKEAAIYPDKALVNDLDIYIITPNGETIRPWILDHTADGVDQNAVRGIDTLNNIEQVTIENPVAGTYSVVIDGKEVPFGPQQFYMTYDLIQENIVLTYPYGGESIIPGNHEFISWDADITNESTFKLEYTIDGGNTWLQIAPALAANVRTYDWIVPQVFSPDAMVRITKNDNGNTSQSGAFFNIMNMPTGLVAIPTCEEDVLLEWQASDYAEQYEVFWYDGNVMSSVGITDETYFLVDEPMFVGEMHWFAVRALGGEDSKSQRTVSVSTMVEDIEICPWDDNPVVEAVGASLIGRDQTVLTLDDEEITMLVKNIGSNDLNTFEIYYAIDGGTPVQETYNGFIATGDSAVISFATLGDFSGVGSHYIDVWVGMTNGNYEYEDGLEHVFYAEQLPNPSVFLPYHEDFSTAVSNAYTQNKVGLEGCVKWDVETNGNGIITVEQDSALIFKTLSNTVGAPTGNRAVFTLNMNHYTNTSEQINLSFDYLSTSQSIAAPFEAMRNKVMLRGSDQDAWIEAYVLGAGEDIWTTIEGIDVTNLLEESGQAFSSSFQIKFVNDNKRAFSINNLLLEVYEEPPVRVADDITDYTVMQFGGNVVLEWTPENFESGLFEIELLENVYNHNNFDVIGTVVAERTTTQPYHNYTFTDTDPGEDGLRHYRIKHVAESGQITFSPTLSVYINEDAQDAIFPNPFVDKLNIAYDVKSGQAVQFVLMDSKGSIVQQFEFDVENGYQLFPVHPKFELPPGIYVLRIIDGAHTTSHKVIKQ